MTESQIDDDEYDGDRATIDKYEVADKLDDLVGDDLSEVEFQLAHDTQMRTQRYNLFEIRRNHSERILYEGDDYAVIKAEDLWDDDSVPGQDTHSTERHIKRLMKGIYEDISKRVVHELVVDTVTNQTHLAIVFK